MHVPLMTLLSLARAAAAAAVTASPTSLRSASTWSFPSRPLPNNAPRCMCPTRSRTRPGTATTGTGAAIASRSNPIQDPRRPGARFADQEPRRQPPGNLHWEVARGIRSSLETISWAVRRGPGRAGSGSAAPQAAEAARAQRRPVSAGSAALSRTRAEGVA